MQTTNETEIHYKHLMGVEIGSAFYALFCEVCHLHQKWGQFVELFGVSEERIRFLNRAAPAFFGTLQRVLWNDVLLHIARINDKSRSGRARRRNLTLSSFAEIILEQNFKAELISHAQKSNCAAAFCADWRNRLLAHTDFEIAMGKSATPIEDASRLNVREALFEIVDFMNVVNVHYGENILHFCEDWGGDDAQELLHILKDGLQLEDLRFLHIGEGRIVPESLRSRPL